MVSGSPANPAPPAGPDTEVPLEVVTLSWQPHMHDRDTGTIDRAGYACCVPGQLRARLRRRGIYAPHSTRWGDPRAELLAWQTWTGQRDTFCEDLALERSR